MTNNKKTEGKQAKFIMEYKHSNNSKTYTIEIKDDNPLISIGIQYKATGKYKFILTSVFEIEKQEDKKNKRVKND